MKGRKLFAIAMVALVAVSGAFAAGSTDSDSYNIGFIGPMTGDNANYGILCENAVRLAVDKCNANGGINGKMVNMITEDSEGTVEKGLAAIEKLSSSDNITALVGPVFTGVAFAVGERCQNEGIPMISPSATHKDITNIGDYVFRTVVSDGLQGDVAGHYFYEVLGYRNIGCLYIKNDYSQGLYEGMKEAFEACGGTVSAVETAQIGDKDFKTQLTRLKASGVEAIYIPNYTVEMAQQLEQASQLGIDVPFLSCDGFSNPDIYNLAGDYTDGVIYVAPAQVEESEAYKTFVEEYTAQFGVAPDSFATNAYDATNIILEAIAKAGNDRAAVRDAIAGIKDYQGVTGTVNFAANGDLVAYQGIYEVEGTTPVFLGSYTVDNGKLIQVD